MRFYTLIFLAWAATLFPARGQFSGQPEWGYGIRASAHVGFLPLPGQAQWSGIELRLSATAQYRYPIGRLNNQVSAMILSSLNFNYRGLGSYNDRASDGRRFGIDGWLGPGLLGGWGAPLEGVELVTNHANWAMGMNQPYGNSLLLATRGVMRNVFAPTADIRFQRLGTGVLTLNRVQVAYTNDGGPIIHNLLGDGLDRWWTGSFSLRYSAVSWMAQASYGRFTGFRKNAFEWSNLMGYKAVLYDADQARYNKGQYRLDLISRGPNATIGGSVTIENFDSIDLQNVLHLQARQAFHPTYNPESIKIGIIYDYRPQPPFWTFN